MEWTSVNGPIERIKIMLTGRQNGIFRPLAKAAYKAYCDRGGVGSYDDFYRRELMRAIGVFTTKQIKSGVEFDTICAHFATLSGDEKQIEYWSRAPERRAIWILRKSMGKARVGDAYVQGIAKKMGFGDRPVKDLPAELILKLNTAVFLYKKRQAKKEVPAI